MIYRLLDFLCVLLRCLPVSWICAIGRFAGGVAYCLDRRHVHLVLSQLRIAFPGYRQKEITQIAKHLFVNLGEGALEFLTYRKASRAYCLSRLEAVHEDIPHRVMQQGKGMIFLTAHYGNWELLGILGYALMARYKVCAVGRDSGNAQLDCFIQEIREGTGMRIFPKKGVLRGIIETLRCGHVACFLADQAAGKDGVPVQFFGRSTMAVGTPAHLAFKTGAPIVPVFIERVRAGYHRITYCNPIAPSGSTDARAEVNRMTQEGITKLEEFIRRRPDHWFWLHKRWKSKKAKKHFQDAYRIVVFAPHWIGDAVLSLPAQASIRRLYPNASLAIAYPRGLEGLYRGLGFFDERISYGWTPTGFSNHERRLFLHRLRDGVYDMVVLFPNSIDSALLAFRAGIRHRVGYAAHGRRFLLTHALFPRISQGMHQAQKYHCIVEALGDVSNTGLPAFTLAAQDIVWAQGMLGVSREKIRVGIHPGATYGPTKRWFPERFIEIGKMLSLKKNMQVVFLGSEQEKNKFGSYGDMMDFPLLDLMGKTDLGKLLGVLSQIDVLIANDSGPMHLASLVGTPTVGIFGSTDPAATSPLGLHRAVRIPIACSPCLKRTCNNTMYPFECLDRVHVEDVLNQVLAILEMAKKEAQHVSG